MKTLEEAFLKFLESPPGKSALNLTSIHDVNYSLRVAFMTGAMVQMEMDQAEITKRLHELLFAVR